MEVHGRWAQSSETHPKKLAKDETEGSVAMQVTLSPSPPGKSTLLATHFLRLRLFAFSLTHAPTWIRSTSLPVIVANARTPAGRAANMAFRDTASLPPPGPPPAGADEKESLDERPLGVPE